MGRQIHEKRCFGPERKQTGFALDQRHGLASYNTMCAELTSKRQILQLQSINKAHICCNSESINNIYILDHV